ncbi:MAG: hypothetical protein M3P82_03810, partial [Bacteroidota bacterium]|nr:hypothetical protein [Bacteroidota bacterium]
MQQPLGTTTHFLKIKFINPQTGFITGGGNKILRTSNSGSTWEEIPTVQSISEIRDFYFVNQTTGFAVGTYACCYPLYETHEPVILKTTDSGNNWNEIYRENNPANPKILTSTMFVNELTGYVTAGYFGFGNNYLFRSTDGGTTWIEFSNILVNQFPFDIFFLNETKGISSLYRSLMKTDNGGFNWSEASDLVYNFYDIFFLNNSTGYITGGELNFGGSSGGRSIILKTTDSGNNWNESLNLSGRKYNLLSSIHFPSQNIGYSVGTYYPGYPEGDTVSLIFKTTNEGLSWGAQNPNVLYHRSLISVYFLDDNTGFIV